MTFHRVRKTSSRGDSPSARAAGECPLRVRPGAFRLIDRGHLATLERSYLGPHSWISEVQHPQAPILHLGYRLDAHEPVTPCVATPVLIRCLAVDREILGCRPALPAAVAAGCSRVG